MGMRISPCDLQGIVKVFEMLEIWRGVLNVIWMGSQDKYFCRRHLLNFYWMTGWSDKHKISCEALWAAWLFHTAVIYLQRGNFTTIFH